MKVKKRLRNVIYFIGFVLGCLILLYPTISDRWNRYRAGKLISEYSQGMAAEAKIDYSKELMAAMSYNERLLGEIVPDVFAEGEVEHDEEYENLLNYSGDGMMGYVEIPKIDVLLPIYHGTAEETLAKGVGHVTGSALPVGGESTHCVLSAHRGLPSVKMFTDLNLLEFGDVFFLHVMGEILVYEVDSIQVVNPDEVTSLAVEKGKDYCTLVTCTPYAVNTHRLLVRGHRIAYEEKQYEEIQEAPKTVNKNMIWAQIICVFLGIALSAIIVTTVNKVQNKKKK